MCAGFVTLKISLGLETLGALVTFKWAFIAVASHVDFKIRAGSVGLFAALPGTFFHWIAFMHNLHVTS